MNPYQIMGVITVCALLFAGVVALLTMQGMHVLSAFACVYIVAVGSMISMQRRARHASDESLLPSQGAADFSYNSWQLSAPSGTAGMVEGDRRRSHKFGA